MTIRVRVRVPRDGEKRPDRLIEVPAIDTGGAWRATHRSQFSDPDEPHSDHESANCTMSSGATCYQYNSHHDGGSAMPWGGDMRHSQDDLSGGTDLNDLAVAWGRYAGAEFAIWSGKGWDDVERAHNEGRAIVIQGEGDCPGSGTFTGGHACCIGPETDSNGKWLWSDPCTSGWQWVTPSSIRDWAQRLNSNILFGVSIAPRSGGGSADMAINQAGLAISSDHKVRVLRNTAIYKHASGDEVVATAYEGYEYAYLGTATESPSRRAAQISTSLIYEDGTSRRTLLYLDNDDVEVFQVPAEPVEEGDPLEARQAQWDADAAALIGPRPA